MGSFLFDVANAGKFAANVCPGCGANGQVLRQNFSGHQSALYFVLHPPVVGLNLFRIFSNLRTTKKKKRGGLMQERGDEEREEGQR
jgi:hypothetical protein